MVSCLIYSNAVIAGLIIRRQMYEMLRHPVLGARNIIIWKRTIATMTRGTKCYIVLQYFAYNIFDDYWTCRVLVKIYKNILGGLMLLHPPKCGLD